MKKEVKDLLTRIYNTLALISTKGEDTMMMADCMRAIQSIVEEANKEEAAEAVEEKAAE